MLWNCKRLTICCERLKIDGLAAPEAAKLNEYVWKIFNLFEELSRVKEYKTPHAFRSLARIYILLMPIIYSPYFLHVTKETNFLFGLFFNIITVIGISGIFNIYQALEDSFDEEGLDDIHITTELTQLKNFIELLDVDSNEFTSYDRFIKFEKLTENKYSSQKSFIDSINKVAETTKSKRKQKYIIKDNPLK